MTLDVHVGIAKGTANLTAHLNELATSGDTIIFEAIFECLLTNPITTLPLLR